MEEQVFVEEDNKVEEITKCLNCGTEFQGKFCPNCGQRADTCRFTIKSVFQNFILGILSNDGGVWFTVKNLFSRPGHMMVDILNGKRKCYFSPFPMLFLVLSLYIVIFSITGSKKEYFEHIKDIKEEVVEDEQEMSKESELANDMINLFKRAAVFYSDNYSIVFIVTIPVYVMSARAAYGKKGRKRYNWAEYSIPIIYSLIMLVLYRCIMSAVYYFSPDASGVLEDFIFIVNIIVFSICFKQMLEFSVAKMVWRSFLTLVLYWMLIGVLLVSLFLISVAILYYS